MNESGLNFEILFSRILSNFVTGQIYLKICPSLPRIVNFGNLSMQIFELVVYRAFHRFRQAKFPNGGFISNTAPDASKNTAHSKVVKIDPKIIISLN